MASWGSSWKDSWGSAWGSQGNADVKVSWLQFDTQATPCDVKVSWLQFDTQAVVHDVKVSWLQLDTQAKQQSAKSGVNRLFYYQLQEEALKEKTERAKPLPYVEPYKLEELKDGSAVITWDETRKRNKETKPSTQVDKPVVQLYKPPHRITVEPVSDLLLVWNTSIEVRALLDSYLQNVVKFKQDLTEDEILLLFA